MNNNVLLIGKPNTFYLNLKQKLDGEGFSLKLNTNDEIGICQKKTALILLISDKQDDNALSSLRKLVFNTSVPIVVLAEYDDTRERIRTLESGAEDYILHSVDRRELVARIRIILRRRLQNKSEQISENMAKNKVSLCTSKREVYSHGKLIELTGTEYEMLNLLMSNAGRIVSKMEIGKQVFDRTISRHDRSIDMHICSIRKKLSRDSDSIRIKTVRGMGYIYLN
jgi:DNA-binding response OmpR family regulator